MSKNVYFSEWTDYELMQKQFCHCDCHQHPGTYPNSEYDPCHVCGHVHEYGYFPYTLRDGWVAYWRSDKVNLNGN